MIIALFLNPAKESAVNVAKTLIPFLENKKVQIVMEDDIATTFNTKSLSETQPKDISYIISLGGDGTILRLVHKYEELNVPILGINLGHLGFMADIPKEEIEESLEDLLNGAYTIDERITIEAYFEEQKRCFAVNDIVIHRGNNPNIIELGLHVDGVYLNTFEADGIIIATPNGSTAYSLAAGGPLLSPALEALVITPICPHTISNRPIVLTDECEIQLEYLTDADPVEVRADGISPFALPPKCPFYIKRGSRNFKLINLLRRDYFSTVRTKLAWFGKLRKY